MNLDKVEEEMAANYSDEEEDDIIHIGEEEIFTSGFMAAPSGHIHHW